MNIRSLLLLALALLLLPAEGTAQTSTAQTSSTWWNWALPTVQPEQTYRGDDRAYDDDRDYRDDRVYGEAPRRRAHRKRGPKHGEAIPPGHLPPSGECRLWYYERPPGQQPPPVSCERLAGHRYPGAVVVTHRGQVYRDRAIYRDQATQPARRSYPRTGRGGWEIVVWGEIVFESQSRQPAGQIVGTAGLERILGRSRLDQLRHERPYREGQSALEGRWIEVGRGGRALQVRAGGAPVAELSDVDGDGRVDAVLMRREQGERARR
jgi:hypothetical protein